jgi:sn-glycerol 3-phosphate transport system ATP-binding protein
MVFQNYALYPHMTVGENLAFSLMLARQERATIEAKVNRAAEILGLASLLSRYPRQLSGGQRQRVAMGRAIVRQPQVFLFDEPLSNLDAKLRAATRIEIKKLHAELGITSLFVTHDQVEAMTLAQRMIVMNAGRAEQIGSPMEVYENPQTMFVAGFIGSPPMHLLRGEARGSSFRVDGQTHDLPAPAPRDGPLVLGVRPEHVEWDGRGSWQLPVDVVETLGAERLVYCRLGTQLFTVRIDGTLPAPTPASSARLGLVAERLHWFDPETTMRVA